MANYFKNTELASRYNISEATVRNWIKSTLEGKLLLELVDNSGRKYVAKSVVNIPTIEKLIEQNRKYRNSLSVKSITVEHGLRNVFSESEVHDIARSMELYHEIPRQYGYFGDGAKEWDGYVSKQVSVDAPSVARRTIELLAANSSYLDERLSKFKKVNVVDIGVGNAVPVRDLLKRLIEQGKLGRYIAIDFSPDMLRIAQHRLYEWFGDRIEFEGHRLDISHERFADIIAEDYSDVNSINLILFLGATPTNLRVPDDAFRIICESMNPHDLLVYTDKIDEPGDSPEWIEHSYAIKPQEPKLLDRHRFVLDRLGIDDSYYVAEIGYNKESRLRYSRARLRFGLELKFVFAKGTKVIRFEKGDAITVWRCWRMTPHMLEDLLDRNGFYVTHSSQSEDRYILAISELRADRLGG